MPRKGSAEDGGETKEEPTLPYLLRHLPKYKAPGCLGDRYEHYQVMPFALVEVLIHDALNAEVTDGFAAIWRAGLLHPGDKQKKDSSGTWTECAREQGCRPRCQNVSLTGRSRDV